MSKKVDGCYLSRHVFDGERCVSGDDALQYFQRIAEHRIKRAWLLQARNGGRTLHPRVAAMRQEPTDSVTVDNSDPPIPAHAEVV